jgi:hypothetical protein
LENWLQANKTYPHGSQAIKYIYINLNIGYGKQSNSLLQKKILGVQIDNKFNLIITYQVYVSIDVVQHALPWWQLQG